MDLSWEGSDDLSHLFLESLIEHLISLVEDQELDVLNLKLLSVDQILNSSWSSDNNLDSSLESLDIFRDLGSSSANVALDSHVLSDRLEDSGGLLGQLSRGGQNESLDDFSILINDLEGSDSEGSSFSGTGLGLGNSIFFLDEWDDSDLLDERWLFETVGKNSSKKIFLKF